MKSITIHGRDRELATRLPSRADDNRASLSQTIKGILAATLWVSPIVIGDGR